jgi:hypothetical protein
MQQENEIVKIFSKYQKHIVRVTWYLALTLLSFRGVWGYWGDLKEYIVASELGKKSVVVKVDAKEDKYKAIKEKMFKEKGIILTDEDIKKYGFDKQ